MPNRMLYHGSPKLFRRLKPKAHYLADYRPVVFATPLREIALASLQPWNDDIFEQGVVGEDPPYMMELRPNAFRDVYGGKRGYLYTLAPDTFYHIERLARFEQISDLSPEILDVEVIEDALSALQNSNMQMVYFENAEAFRMNDYRQNPGASIACRKYANEIFRHLYRARLMNPGVVSHIVPIMKPFYFAHFTNNGIDIMGKGFLGRADELINTKRTYGEIVREGHIFAFRLDATSLREGLQELQDIFDAAEDESQHIFEWSPIGMYGLGLVISKAEMGVEMYHSGDQEMQMIIPIACIDENEMLVVSDFFEQYGLEEW